ncbi:MAG TPA: signal peptidase II [Alphaproteobacteria bacterium]
MLRLGLAVALGVLVLDQALKAVMLGLLPEPGSVRAVTGFFNLVHVRNTGVSFGMLQSDSRLGPWLLAGFAIVVSAALGVWLARAPSRLLAVALGLTIGGALGNVIDRVRFGAVFDFLDLHAFGWHWPAFNLADSAVTVGVAGLLLSSLLAPARGTRVKGPQ